MLMDIRAMLVEEANAGILAVRTWGSAAGPKDIFQADCLKLFIDSNSGGIWYQLDPTKQFIPINKGMVYIPPSGILAIAFKERELV